MTIDLIDQTLHYLQECFHPGNAEPQLGEFKPDFVDKDWDKLHGKQSR